MAPRKNDKQGIHAKTDKQAQPPTQAQSAKQEKRKRLGGGAKAAIAIIAIILACALGLGIANAMGIINVRATLAQIPGISALFNSDGDQAGTDVLDVDDKGANAVRITLSFTGDCTLGTDEYFAYSSSFNAKYAEVNNPGWFFANFVDVFKADDLTIVDMEGTLTTSTTRMDKEFAFKGPAEYVQVLVQGDVEAATMANNHSSDYGTSSYSDTVKTLNDAGIETFGYESIAYIDVKGVKVALIGAYALAGYSSGKAQMLTNIEKAKSDGANCIVVYAHWGEEKSYVPDKAAVDMGRAAIDAGADLVVGTHPHVMQGYELYHGHYIVYSLGNFCFGGNTRPFDMDCLVVQKSFSFADGELIDQEELVVIPARVTSASGYNNYQPTPATGSEAERILAKVADCNSKLAQL